MTCCNDVLHNFMAVLHECYTVILPCVADLINMTQVAIFYDLSQSQTNTHVYSKVIHAKMYPQTPRAKSVPTKRKDPKQIHDRLIKYVITLLL